MQSRRWLHGSSGGGELGVFGATRYFAAGRGDDRATVVQPAQKVAGSFGAGYGDVKLESQEELMEELVKPAGTKSKLAAFFGFMVSPSSRGASFRRTKLPPPTAKSPVADSESAMKVSLSSTTSSRGSTITDYDLLLIASTTASVQLKGGLDLGVATGDRRLQGVKVVRRGSGGDDDDEERWVVRCTTPCWDQEFDAASSWDQIIDQQGEGCTNPAGNWESDSSSDLFDLDIDCADL